MAENPYRPPTGEAAEPSLPALTLEELAAFSHDELEARPTGYTPQHYVNALRKHPDGNAFVFNLGAALVGPIWCFYRKLYGAGVVLLVVEVLSLLMLSLVGPVLMRLALSFLATRLYLARAAHVVAEVRAMHRKRPEALEHLGRRGGTSPLGAAGALVLSLLLVIGSAVVAALVHSARRPDAWF